MARSMAFYQLLKGEMVFLQQTGSVGMVVMMTDRGSKSYSYNTDCRCTLYLTDCAVIRLVIGAHKHSRINAMSAEYWWSSARTSAPMSTLCYQLCRVGRGKKEMGRGKVGKQRDRQTDREKMEGWVQWRNN